MMGRLNEVDDWASRSFNESENPFDAKAEPLMRSTQSRRRPSRSLSGHVMVILKSQGMSMCSGLA